MDLFYLPTTYNQLTHAKAISKEYINRAIILKEEYQSLIKRNGEDINQLLNEDGREEEINDLLETYENYTEQMERLQQIISINDLVTEDLIKEINKMELDFYNIIATQDIREQLKRERESQQQMNTKIEEIVNDINTMWDDGKSEEEIKDIIRSKLKDIARNFTDEMFEYMINYLFILVTRDKSVRVNLNDQQISKLKRITIEEDNENTCTTCLNRFKEGEDVIVLPCNDKHMYHTNCIVPWLKMSVHCPLCKADIRTFLN